MDAITKELLTSLRDIRDKADTALRRMQSTSEQRSLAWRCTACGYIKHFTRPAPAEVASPCPKCQGSKFEPP
jgi:rubrerythrin